MSHTVTPKDQLRILNFLPVPVELFFVVFVSHLVGLTSGSDDSSFVSQSLSAWYYRHYFAGPEECPAIPPSPRQITRCQYYLPGTRLRLFRGAAHLRLLVLNHHGK
jgi:hypothetical protein